MPGRLSHLPTHFERSALQKLLALGELPAAKLGGHGTINRMLAKGWIERRTNQAYLITPEGVTALKAKIPER